MWDSNTAEMRARCLPGDGPVVGDLPSTSSQMSLCQCEGQVSTMALYTENPLKLEAGTLFCSVACMSQLADDFMVYYSLDKRVTHFGKIIRGGFPVVHQLITIQRASYRGGRQPLAEAAVGKPHSWLYHWLHLLSLPVKTRTGKEEQEC